MQFVIVTSLLVVGMILSDEQAQTSQIDGQQAQHLPLINNQTGECVEIVRCNYEHFGTCSISLHINHSERKCKYIFGDDTDTNFTTLSFATKMSQLPDAINEFQKLESIYAYRVQLEIVEKGKLAAFRGIRILDLTGNLITELAPDTFDDLEDLSILDLYSNKLKTLPRDVFQGLHNLTLIDLHSNRIEILPDGLFRNNRKLEAISLDGNKINVLHRDMFKELHNLTSINLSRNQLGNLPDGLFRDNHKLKQIQLNRNKINVLHRDIFKELQNLENIDLTYNQLEYLPDRLFRDNQKLEQIWLHDNKIRKIECNFYNLPKLEFLFLTHNICINEAYEIARIDKEANGQPLSDTISISAMQTQISTKCNAEKSRNLFENVESFLGLTFKSFGRLLEFNISKIL